MKQTVTITGLLCGLIALTLPALFGAKDTKRTPEQIVKLWESGPARYLMNAKEYEEIRHLKTIPELARFITEFWARRDPSPGTFENEYRREYWNRILEANKRFRDSTTPGWKTDRGKVFILLGEPNFVESDEHPHNSSDGQRQKAGPGASDQGSRGIERWHFNRRLSRSAAPEFMIAFVRDTSLDWRLSDNADLLEPSFPGLSTSSENDPAFAHVAHVYENQPTESTPAGGGLPPGPVRRAPPPPSLEAGVLPTLDASAFATYDLGLELAVPSNAELVLATVTSREFLSGFQMTPRFEFFRAQDGSTFVNVGALTKVEDLYADRKEGASDLRIYASLMDSADSSRVHYATNEKSPLRFNLSQGPAPGNLIDAWTGLALPPGRYVATLAVEDTLSGRLGRASAEIEVPDFSGETLALSSLVPASAIAEAQGRLGVTARSSGVFKRSEEFGVYYEVYGLAAQGEGARFEASYRFFRDADGRAAPIGKPIVFADRTEGVQGWSFPLAKWPAGRYRLEVSVSAAGKQPVSSTLPFEVID